MNTLSFLSMIRQEKARDEARRKQEARRADLIETIIAAALAVLIGLIAV